MMQRWKHAKTKHDTQQQQQQQQQQRALLPFLSVSKRPLPKKIHISQPHILSQAPAAVNLNPNKPIKTLETQPCFVFCFFNHPHHSCSLMQHLTDLWTHRQRDILQKLNIISKYTMAYVQFPHPGEYLWRLAII